MTRISKKNYGAEVTSCASCNKMRPLSHCNNLSVINVDKFVVANTKEFSCIVHLEYKYNWNNITVQILWLGMDNLNDTPEECIPCDPVCVPLNHCPNGLCYALPTVYIIAFSLWGTLLSRRLYLFFKFVPFPRWSLKKFLFLCGIITCIMRVIR